MSDIVATPGASNANAYCTQAEADAYFADRVAHPGWATATDDIKRRAILQATRELDGYVEWLGSATSLTQALAWPRMGLTDPETGASIAETVIPKRLKNATAEQAAALLSGDRATELAQHAQGLKRLVAGAVELEFDSASATIRPVLTPGAFQLVAPWGRMKQPGLGGAVPLARA